MKDMNNIAMNDEIYEQIESSYIEYKEPEFDIKNDMQIYIESLKPIPATQRENKLKNWISAKVKPILTAWERKYAGGDQLLNNIQVSIDNLKDLKYTEQTNIDNLQSKITTYENAKSRIENKIQNSVKKLDSNKKIDLKYEKMKAIMFLVVSFLIAFGTYTYFIKGQIEMDWATQSQGQKISTVKEMILNGEKNYYNIFSQYIVNDDDEPISIDNITNASQLSRINGENIYEAPSPTIWQGIKYHPSFLLLSVAAFLLILMGKIMAIIYEKLNYPRWMFYLVSALAAVVLIGAIVSTSSLNSLKTEKTFLKDQIKEVATQIEDIKFSTDLSRGRRGAVHSNNTEIKELKKKLNEYKDKSQNLNKEIGNYKFKMMLLFIFSELLIGSIAWMTYAEYIEKKMRLNSGESGNLENLKENKKKIEDDIKELKKSIEEKNDRINKATGIENKLTALQGKIHSNAEIKNIAQQHLHSLLADGDTMLLVAESKWAQEDKGEKG
jgi:predicted  nucleic acid-binding Zn-ribbon protein